MRTYMAGTLMLLGVGACAPASPDWEPRIREANDVLLNQGAVDRVADFFDPSFVVHATGGDQSGRDVIENYVTAIREAFPDLHVEIEVLATEGDRVVWRRTNRATHQGDFMGVPASGRTLEWYDIVVTRYQDGMIAEEWGESGLPGVLLAP